MLLIDAANVIGSRPDGWWRDRPGAARRFATQVRDAARDGLLDPPVTVVVEGAARRGIGEGTEEGVTVVHAPGSGDDTIAALATPDTLVVTADRGLRERVAAAGARTVGPGWLRDRLDPRSA